MGGTYIKYNRVQLDWTNIWRCGRFRSQWFKSW